MKKISSRERDDDIKAIEQRVQKQLGQMMRRPQRKRPRKIRPRALGSLKRDALFNLLDKANPEHQALREQIAQYGFTNTAQAACARASTEGKDSLSHELKKQCVKAAQVTANLRRDVLNATDPTQRRIQGALNSIPSWARAVVREAGNLHAMPNAIQAETSPGGYLAHLYQIANANGTDYDYGIAREEDDIYHIDKRRPDILQIQLSEANAKKEIPTIHIVNNVLTACIENKKTAELEHADLENVFFPPALPYVADIENTQLAMQSLGVESLNALDLRTQPIARPESFSDASKFYYFINNVAEPLQLGTMNTGNIGDEVALLKGELDSVNTWMDLLGYTSDTGPDEGKVPVDDFIHRMGMSKDELNLLYRQYEAFDDLGASLHWENSQEYPHNVNGMEISGDDLSGFLNSCDQAVISTFNGDSYVSKITFPPASDHSTKSIQVIVHASMGITLNVNGTEKSYIYGLLHTYYSTGSKWEIIEVPPALFGATLYTNADQWLHIDNGTLQISDTKDGGKGELRAPRHRSLNYLLRLSQGTGISPVDLDWIASCEGAAEATSCNADSTTEPVKKLTDAGLNLLAHFIHYRDTWGLDANTYVGLIYTLNPYGYFVPIPTQPDSTEEPETIVYSQLRTLFGEEGARTVREACLDSGITIGTVDDDDELKGLLCAGLQISKAEWDAITPLLENYNNGDLILDEKVLSQIARIPTVCQLMGGLSVLYTLELCDERFQLTSEILSATPITALSGINKLIWLCQWMSDNGYSPESLSETLSSPTEHETDPLNYKANKTWLLALKDAMAGNKVTEETFTRYEDVYLDNGGSNNLLNEFTTNGIIDSYGLVMSEAKDDVESFVNGTLTSGWSIWPPGDDNGVQYKANLTNTVWNGKLQQDRTTLNKVAELNTNASQSAIKPMLLWLGYPETNIYVLSQKLLAWDYPSVNAPPISAERTSLLWDLRNRLTFIQKHQLLGEDIGLLVLQLNQQDPTNSNDERWLSADLTLSSALDWPTIYALTLFKHLQVGSATAESWLAYLALVNASDGEAGTENINAFILAGLLGCHPDDILTYYNDLDNQQLPTHAEAIDHMARRIDIGIELDLSAQEMIPLLECATGSIDPVNNQNACASAELAIQRHESSDPEQLYQSASSERKRDALVALYMKNLVWIDSSPLFGVVFDNESLYRYLLLDVNVSSQVPTSVIVEAHSSLQLYIYRALSHLESPVEIHNPIGLETSWPYDKEYRIWQANEELAIYPSNYIEPEMRSQSSSAYRSFMSGIQSSSFEDEDIDQQVYSYLESLQEEIEVKVISFCKEYYQDDPRITYHFVSQSIHNPAYYYRKVDINTDTLSEREDWLTSLTWTFWQLLSIPAVNEIVSNIVVGVTEHQLYFIWMELQQTSSEPDNETYEFQPLYAKANAGLELNCANSFEFNLDESHLQEFQGRSNKPENVIISQTVNEVDNSLLASFTLSNSVIGANMEYDLRVNTCWSELSVTEDSGVIIQLSKYDLNLEDGEYFHAYGPRLEHGSHVLNNSAVQTKTQKVINTTLSSSFAYDSCHIDCMLSVKVELLLDHNTGKWSVIVKSNTHNDNIVSTYESDNYFLNAETPYRRADENTSSRGYLQTSFNVKLDNAQITSPNWWYIDQHLPDFTLHSHPEVISTPLINSSSAKQSPKFYLTPSSDCSVTVDVRVTYLLEDAYYLEALGFTGEFKANDNPTTVSLGRITFNFTYQGEDIPAELIAYTHSSTTNLESYLCFPTIANCTTSSLVSVNHTTALQSVTMQAPSQNGCQSLFNKTNQQLPEGDVNAFWDALLAKETALEVTYINQAFPPNEIFDFNGAYGQYGWELFYHIPSMIASAATDNQQYEAAIKWFKQIYNPQATSAGEKWGVLPIQNAFQTQNGEYTNYGFNDPDLIACQNPSYYGYATIRQFLQMMIQAGDDQYSLASQESLQKAKMIYVEAQGLLELERPDDVFNMDQTVWSNPTLTQVLNGEVALLTPVNYELYALSASLNERIKNLRDWKDINGEPLNVPLYAPKINPRELQKANQQGNTQSDEPTSPTTPIIDALEYPTISAKAKDTVDRLIRLSDRIVGAYDKFDSYNIKLAYQLGVTTGYEDVDRDDLYIPPDSYDDPNKDHHKRSPQFVQKLMIEQSEAHVVASRARLAAVLTELSLATAYYLKWAVKTIGIANDLAQTIKDANTVINEILPSSLGVDNTVKEEARNKKTKAEADLKLLHSKSLAKIPSTMIAGLSCGGIDPITSDVIQATNKNTKAVHIVSEDLYKLFNYIKGDDGKKASIFMAKKSCEITELSSEVRAAKLEKKINEATFNMEVGAYGSELANEEAIKNATLNASYYQGFLNELVPIYDDIASSAYEMCDIAKTVYQSATSQCPTYPNIPIYNSKYTLATMLLYPYKLEHFMIHMDLDYQNNKPDTVIRNTLQLSLASQTSDKGISLLDNLRKQGWCEFTLDQDFYDVYIPQLRSKRIDDIKVTFHGVNENMQMGALLTQTGHQVHMHRNTKMTPVNKMLPISEVVTDTQRLTWSDEMPMPFKRTGAVSSWRLSIPCLDQHNAKRTRKKATPTQVAFAKEMQDMLDNHLKDVMIEVTYTAIQG
ncbi:hypothetical protein KCM76_20760 [Zooshikella marina]|uniref:neuraminidase-like domain-containing protein n=1 Tax=Zooshikella ganghwensis TaxID=202772 RepID=UPI001BAEA55C|nr:neuraminidase-like domain-containing protein [Zooshikella ganghwensis]MBU2708437.1 hypothetical protein [Zooshikella ganghwensis]